MSPIHARLAEVIREWAQVFMHRSGRDFKCFMAETGLTFSQVNVLMFLFHQENCGVSEIGQRMGVSSAAASQAVERLVQMGMVERRQDPTDRRSHPLGLTEKGHALIRAGINARSLWIEELTRSLSQEQQELVISALTILTSAAREMNE